MIKKTLLNSQQLNVTLTRLARQIIENHHQFNDLVIIGLQPRGTATADRIKDKILQLEGVDVPIGYLDATFFRDDFRQKGHLKANSTHIPFLIENKTVILVDDVLYTGRSVRSALDAMQAFGRPAKVELLVLIDRLYTRELPIEARYIGCKVNSVLSQRVQVDWKDERNEEDNVWIVGDKS